MDSDIVDVMNAIASDLCDEDDVVVRTVNHPDDNNDLEDIQISCGIKTYSVGTVTEKKLEGACTIDYQRSPWSYTHITCEYTNGLLNGSYVESSNGSHRTICQYRNGVLHGPYKELNANIVIVSMRYLCGRKEGLYERNHENGAKWIRCSYSNDLKEGEYMEFYEHGVLKEYCSKYTNGEKNGIHAIFDDTGEVLEEGNYVMGVPHGVHKLYYRRFHLVWEKTYDHGKLKDTQKRSTHQNIFDNFVMNQDALAALTSPQPSN